MKRPSRDRQGTEERERGEGERKDRQGESEREKDRQREREREREGRRDRGRGPTDAKVLKQLTFLPSARTQQSKINPITNAY